MKNNIETWLYQPLFNEYYNYDIECSLSSLKTEGAVPPATETLETLPRPTSLLPCIA